MELSMEVFAIMVMLAFLYLALVWFIGIEFGLHECVKPCYYFNNQTLRTLKMPRMRLLPTTEAAVSNPFSVRGDENLSVVASGLAGVEEAVVQIYDGVDFVDLTEESATMTATAPVTQITAGGLYRIRKDATAGEAGVVVG